MTESRPWAEALFVDRAEIAPKVLDHLCDEKAGRRVVALHGAPGFGKTTLVEWICQHDRVREHFPDGTLSVRFGDPSSPELLGCVLDCCYQVSGDRPPYTTIPQAGEHLGRLLDGQRKLIFLDAVWHASDLDPFLAGGKQCARVITTRNLGALPRGTLRIRVDKMTRDEARKLLAYDLESDDEAHFGPLLDQADGWPLLLSLLNGMLRQEIEDHESSLEDAVAFAGSWLEAGFTNEEEKIKTAVETSLERLKGLAGQATLVRFRQLGIFPEGIDIPVAQVLPSLWAPLSDLEIHHELAKFTQLSLVEKFDVPKGTIRLHKVIRDYLRKHNEAQLPRWNQHLLDAYRRTLPAGQAWYALAPEPHYPWQNLAFHLREAGLGAELVAAVRDLRYLSRRAFRYGPAAADSDLRHAQICSPSDESVLALQAVFRSAPGRLSDFRRQADMAATLATQFGGVDSLVGEVTQLLPTIEPPYHRMEWMVGDKPQAIVGRHDDQPVNAVASDALGTRAASGGADKLVRIWDTTAGPASALLATLGGHTAPVNSLSFDGTGTRVASAAADGTVRVWQVAPGEPYLVATLKGHSAEVNAASFDGSGTRLASAAADGTVRIWTNLDADRPTSEVLAGTHQFVNAVSLDAGGTCLAMGAANGVLSVWSLDGEEPSELWTESAHSAAINAVTVDKAGKRVLSGDAEGMVRVFEATSGAPLVEWRAHHDGPVFSAKFDGTGTRVVTGGADGSVRIWDAGLGRLVVGSDLGSGVVNSVACDDSGTRVISGTSEGRVRMFLPVALEPIGARGDWAGLIKCVAVDPSGTRVAAGRRDGAVRMYDGGTGAEMRIFEGHGPFVNGVAWRRDGARILSAGADGTARIWDPDSGHEVMRLVGHGSPTGDWREVNDAQFDASGAWVVTAGADGTVRIWDAQSGAEVQRFGGHGTPSGEDHQVNVAIFDSTAAQVLSGGSDGTLRLWKLDGGAEVMKLSAHRGWVNCVQIDRSGRGAISADYLGTVIVWDATTWKPLYEFETGGWVTFAEFDPQTGLVIVNGQDSLQVWDAGQKQMLSELRLDCSIFGGSCGPDGTVALGTDVGAYGFRLVTARNQGQI